MISDVDETIKGLNGTDREPSGGNNRAWLFVALFFVIVIIILIIFVGLLTATFIKINNSNNDNEQQTSTTSSSTTTTTAAANESSPMTTETETAATILSSKITVTTISIPVESSTTVTTSTPQLTSPLPPTKGEIDAANSILNSFDETADKCENFFQFACGKWYTDYPVGSSVGSLAELELEEAIGRFLYYNVSSQRGNNNNIGAVEKAKIAFDVCYNSAKGGGGGGITNATNITIDVLNMFGGWPIITENWTKSEYEFEYLIGYLWSQFAAPTLLSPIVGVDAMNTSRYILYISGGINQLYHYSLGGGNSNTELSQLAKQSKDLPTVADITSLAMRIAKAEGIVITDDMILRMYKDAVDILQLLANLTHIGQENYTTTAPINYHRFTIGDLFLRHPHIQWDMMISGLLSNDLVSETQEIVFYSIDYWDKIDSFIGKVLYSNDIRSLYNLFLYQFSNFLLNNNATSSIAYHAIDEFHSTIGATCAKEIKASILPQAISRLYADNFLPADFIDDGQQIINYINIAWHSIFQNVWWFDGPSRDQVMNKLDNMQIFAGYPRWVMNDTLLNNYYSKLEIAYDDSFDDIRRKAKVYGIQRDLAKISKPAVRPEDGREPIVVVDGFYQYETNYALIEAGKFRPPIYQIDFPKLFKFARFGRTVAHQIAHGFENEGIKWNWNGSFSSILSPGSLEVGFKPMANCLIDQFNHFCLYDNGTYCLNGFVSLFENFADYGSLIGSYLGWKLWKNMTSHDDYRPLPGLESYDEDQMFMMAFATNFCEHEDPTLYYNYIHSLGSPGKFQVIGNFQNFETFGKLFNCHKNQTMYPTNHCQLW